MSYFSPRISLFICEYDIVYLRTRRIVITVRRNVQMQVFHLYLASFTNSCFSRELTMMRKLCLEYKIFMPSRSVLIPGRYSW